MTRWQDWRLEEALRYRDGLRDALARTPFWRRFKRAALAQQAAYWEEMAAAEARRLGVDKPV